MESGEEVVAEVNEAGQGEAEVSVGIEIPLMEAGSNLLEEYKEGIGSDETLVEWRCCSTERKNGFMWDSGVLTRMVEDDFRENRQVVVIPKQLRPRMMRLVQAMLELVRWLGLSNRVVG